MSVAITSSTRQRKDTLSDILTIQNWIPAKPPTIQVPVEMNKHVELTELQYSPSGSSHRYELIEKIIEDNGWTRSEIFELISNLKAEKLSLIPF